MSLDLYSVKYKDGMALDSLDYLVKGEAVSRLTLRQIGKSYADSK